MKKRNIGLDNEQTVVNLKNIQFEYVTLSPSGTLPRQNQTWMISAADLWRRQL